MPITAPTSLTPTALNCWPRCPRAAWWGCWNVPPTRGDAPKAVELAHQLPYFHAAVGIHPESLIEEDAPTVTVYHGDWRAELEALRPLFEDKAVVAVGEIGLDHHWPVPRQDQYELFEAQLQLAAELDLPVSVHDREAHAEMYELLRKYKPRGVLHCYSGSAEDAAWLTGQGDVPGLRRRNHL